jgi:hypothetical protein
MFKWTYTYIEATVMPKTCALCYSLQPCRRISEFSYVTLVKGSTNVAGHQLANHSPPELTPSLLTPPSMELTGLAEKKLEQLYHRS